MRLGQLFPYLITNITKQTHIVYILTFKPNLTYKSIMQLLNSPQLKLLDRAFNIVDDKDTFQRQLAEGITLKIQKQQQSNCLKDSILCCACLPSEATKLKEQRQHNVKNAQPGILTARKENETLFELRVNNNLTYVGSWYDIFVFEQWQDTFSVLQSSNADFQPTNALFTPIPWQSKITLFFSNHQFRLIFTQQHEHHRFFRIVITLKTYYTKLHPESQYSSMALRHWVEFNQDRDEELQENEISKLVDGLNLEREEFDRCLGYITKGRERKGLSQEEFMRLIEVMQCPKDLYQLFRKYAKSADQNGNIFDQYSHPCMTESQFATFIKQAQHQTSTKTSFLAFNTSAICSSTSSIKTPKSSTKSLSYIQFCHYLFSNSKNPLIEAQQLDFTKPLSYYFVNSSHNTYLVGNQLTSMSSANVYYLNLIEGMRCVELDIHDSSDGPMIKHGFTFTAKILFEEAINAIIKFCVENPYHTPIILSFENHCTEENRIKMANILAKIPFEKFYVIPHKGTNQQQFPSLQQLRGKIIIQGTGDFDEMFPKITKVQKKQTAKSYIKATDVVAPEKLSPYGTGKKHTFIEKVKQMEKQKARAQQVLLDVQKTFQKKRSSATRHLNKYYGMVAAPFNLNNSCWQMANIAQNNLLKMFKGLIPPTFQQIHQYSQTSLIRIYPFGLRFGSSNYNPIPMLQCGCQLVSLNTQNVDVYYVCIQGMFEKNRQEGYMMKPIGKKEGSRSVGVKMVFVGIVDVKPRLVQNNDETTRLEVSFVGSQLDMIKNFRYVNKSNSPQSVDYNESIPISQSFKAQSVYAQLVALNQHKFDQSKSLLKGLTSFPYPCATLEISNMQFANLYVNIPHCGSMSIPLRDARPGLRMLPIYRFDIGRKKTKGHLLVYVEFENFG